MFNVSEEWLEPPGGSESHGAEKTAHPTTQ
jgi:hypothetical protein